MEMYLSFYTAIYLCVYVKLPELSRCLCINMPCFPCTPLSGAGQESGPIVTVQGAEAGDSGQNQASERDKDAHGKVGGGPARQSPAPGYALQ